MEENKSNDYYATTKKSNKTNLLICLVLIVGVTLYYVFGGGDSPSLDVGSDYMTVSGDEDSGFSVTFMYEEITNVNLLSDDEFDMGEMVEGYEGSSIQYGIWNNDQYGDYYLYTVPKLSEYVVITSDSDVLVLNFENNTTTESFYTAIVDMLLDLDYYIEYSTTIDLS